MRHHSLVFFTLAAQTAAGMVVWLAGLTLIRIQPPIDSLSVSGWSLALALGALGVSFLHLGSPLKAAHALRRLKSSWLSREVALALAFTFSVGILFASGLLSSHYPGLQQTVSIWVLWLCAILGAALVLAMAQVYRLRTAPGWNRPPTRAGFCLSALLLGGSVLALAAPTLPSSLAAGLLGCLVLQITFALLDSAGLPWSSPASSPAPRPLAVLRMISLLAALFGLFYGGVLAGAGLILLSELLGRVEFYARRTRLGV